MVGARALVSGVAGRRRWVCFQGGRVCVRGVEPRGTPGKPRHMPEPQRGSPMRDSETKRAWAYPAGVVISLARSGGNARASRHPRLLMANRAAVPCRVIAKTPPVALVAGPGDRVEVLRVQVMGLSWPCGVPRRPACHA